MAGDTARLGVGPHVGVTELQGVALRAGVGPEVHTRDLDVGGSRGRGVVHGVVVVGGVGGVTRRAALVTAGDGGGDGGVGRLVARVAGKFADVDVLGDEVGGVTPRTGGIHRRVVLGDVPGTGVAGHARGGLGGDGGLD